MAELSLLLVDDHEIVRTGLRRLLEDQTDFQVVGEAGNGDEAIHLARQLQPQIILMDLNMPPGIGGLEASRRILQNDPQCKIIIVTVHDGETWPQHLFRVGVLGYLNKNCSMDELISACKEVRRGRRYVSVEVARQLAAKQLDGDEPNPFDLLSAREMQIMMMLVQGLKNYQIAEKLYLSPKTVSTYRYRIFDKLHIQNDVELIHLAGRYGLAGE